MTLKGIVSLIFVHRLLILPVFLKFAFVFFDHNLVISHIPPR